MEYAQQTIVDFLSGNLDVVDFRRRYDEKPEIDAFLQKIIDDMKKDFGKSPISYTRLIDGKEYSFSSVVPYLLAPETDPGLQYCPPKYESVKQLLTYEFRMFTHDVETAQGASRFYANRSDRSLLLQIRRCTGFCTRRNSRLSCRRGIRKVYRKIHSSSLPRNDEEDRSQKSHPSQNQGSVSK